MKHRILVAEDELISQKMLAATLEKWDYDVVAVADGSEALRILCGDEPPEIAILDWMLPDIQGPEICRMVRAINREPYIYIIMLTGKTNHADIIEGIEAGADEYLVKPFDPVELKVRLQNGHRILDLQNQLISARDQLQQMATHDTLTGLFNRGGILDLIQRELSRSRRDGSYLGLVFTDIDHFKKINDTHGHQVGDAALKEFSRLIAQSIRPYDSAGRYGGEEFLLVLPRCGANEANVVAERFRKSVEESHLILSQEEGAQNHLRMTTSLGVLSTELTGNDCVEVFSLVQTLDRALYRAKEGGRNCVEIATLEDLK